MQEKWQPYVTSETLFVLQSLQIRLFSFLQQQTLCAEWHMKVQPTKLTHSIKTKRLMLILASGSQKYKVEAVVGSGRAAREDGRPDECSFHVPAGIAVDEASHSCFIAEYRSHAIRRVSFIEVDNEDRSMPFSASPPSPFLHLRSFINAIYRPYWSTPRLCWRGWPKHNTRRVLPTPLARVWETGRERRVQYNTMPKHYCDTWNCVQDSPISKGIREWEWEGEGRGAR